MSSSITATLALPHNKTKVGVIWAGRAKSGKDTHGGSHANIGFPMFHSGDVLQEHANRTGKQSILKERASGDLSSSDIALALAREWIFRRRKEKIIHLNGMPRTIDQLDVIVPFLNDRGFIPKVIWFTTPEEECLKRPIRPGREIEDSPEVLDKRMRTYSAKTAPMLPAMQEKHGFSVAVGNLLLIDNTNLTKHETAWRILSFLGLQNEIGLGMLFPPEEARYGSGSSPGFVHANNMAFA